MDWGLILFGMIKSIHELWGPPPLITSHYGGFFHTVLVVWETLSLKKFNFRREGETIFFQPLLAKIGLHVVIGNHLPGRANGFADNGVEIVIVLSFSFLVKFVEHFELYFLFC